MKQRLNNAVSTGSSLTMGWDVAVIPLSVWVSPAFLRAILHLCSVRKSKKGTGRTELNFDAGSVRLYPGKVRAAHSVPSRSVSHRAA